MPDADFFGLPPDRTAVSTAIRTIDYSGDSSAQEKPLPAATLRLLSRSGPCGAGWLAGEYVFLTARRRSVAEYSGGRVAAL